MKYLGKISKEALYTTIINCLLVVAALIIVLLFVTTRLPSYGFDCEEVHQWSGTGTILINGEEEQISSLPYKTEGQSGDVLTFTTILKQWEDRSNTLMFRSLHQKVKVYLDNELVLDFGEDNNVLFGKTPGSQWQIIYLPADYDGIELTIETETVYDLYDIGLQEVYIGTKSALLFMIFKQEISGLLIGGPTLLLGFIFLSIGLIFETKATGRRLYYLGLFSVLSGVWMILESRMIQFFSDSTWVYTQIIFIVFSLMPIPLIRFLMTGADIKKSKYMQVVFWISICNFFLIQILQLTEIMDYLETVFFVHVVFVLVIVGVLITYLKAKIQKKLKDRWLFVAAFSFAGFGMIDIIRFYLPVNNADALLCTKIGLASFVLIIGLAGIRQLSKKHAKVIEEQTYKRLAYSDMMTGLLNRTAFEEKMEGFRKIDAKPLIAVVDLNGLKAINDTLGHKYGDDAICRVGRTLKNSFDDMAEVYRIGGDEFSILSEDMDEEEAGKIFAKVTETLKTQGKDLEYHLMAAIGFVKAGAEGVDKAFTEADRIMYENKKFLKGKTEWEEGIKA